jgi:hypothetical protein
MYSLRAEVARQAHELRFYNLVVCVKPGYYGRLTPLTGDLPLSQEQMDVIALIAGSPGENFAVFPLLCALPVLVILMKSVRQIILTRVEYLITCIVHDHALTCFEYSVSQ